VVRLDPFVEELLGFLLTRIDEKGFNHLVAHEPRGTAAPYLETGGGRAETRATYFTGCATCSRIPPGSLFTSYLHINIETWPCQSVRTLALPFANDPDYDPAWRPEFAVFASGKPVRARW